MGNKYKEVYKAKGRPQIATSYKAAEYLQKRKTHSQNLLPSNAAFASIKNSILTSSSLEEVPLILKKILKKDSMTKIKGINELQNLCDDEEKVESIATAWANLFPRLAMDPYDEVRMRSFELNGIIFQKLGKKAAHLIGVGKSHHEISNYSSNAFLSAWLRGFFDPYHSVSSKARLSFDGFIKPEKQIILLSKMSENILNSMLGCILDPNFSSKKSKTENDDPKCFDRVAQSLYVVDYMMTHVDVPLTHHFTTLLKSTQFWGYLNSNSQEIIMIAQIRLLGDILHKYGNDLDKDSIGKITSAIYAKLGNFSFSIQNSAWKACSVVWASSLSVSSTDFDRIIKPKILRVLRTEYNAENFYINLSHILDFSKSVVNFSLDALSSCLSGLCLPTQSPVNAKFLTFIFVKILRKELNSEENSEGIRDIIGNVVDNTLAGNLLVYPNYEFLELLIDLFIEEWEHSAENEQKLVKIDEIFRHLFSSLKFEHENLSQIAKFVNCLTGRNTNCDKLRVFPAKMAEIIISSLQQFIAPLLTHYSQNYSECLETVQFICQSNLPIDKIFDQSESVSSSIWPLLSLYESDLSTQRIRKYSSQIAAILCKLMDIEDNVEILDRFFINTEQTDKMIIPVFNSLLSSSKGEILLNWVESHRSTWFEGHLTSSSPDELRNIISSCNYLSDRFTLFMTIISRVILVKFQNESLESLINMIKVLPKLNKPCLGDYVTKFEDSLFLFLVESEDLTSIRIMKSSICDLLTDEKQREEFIVRNRPKNLSLDLNSNDHQILANIVEIIKNFRLKESILHSLIEISLAHVNSVFELIKNHLNNTCDYFYLFLSPKFAYPHLVVDKLLPLFISCLERSFCILNLCSCLLSYADVVIYASFAKEIIDSINGDWHETRVWLNSQIELFAKNNVSLDSLFERCSSSLLAYLAVHVVQYLENVDFIANLFDQCPSFYGKYILVKRILNMPQFLELKSQIFVFLENKLTSIDWALIGENCDHKMLFELLLVAKNYSLKYGGSEILCNFLQNLVEISNKNPTLFMEEIEPINKFNDDWILLNIALADLSLTLFSVRIEPVIENKNSCDFMLCHIVNVFNFLSSKKLLAEDSLNLFLKSVEFVNKLQQYYAINTNQEWDDFFKSRYVGSITNILGALLGFVESNSSSLLMDHDQLNLSPVIFSHYGISLALTIVDEILSTSDLPDPSNIGDLNLYFSVVIRGVSSHIAFMVSRIIFRIITCLKGKEGLGLFVNETIIPAIVKFSHQIVAVVGELDGTFDIIYNDFGSDLHCCFVAYVLSWKIFFNTSENWSSDALNVLKDHDLIPTMLNISLELIQSENFEMNYISTTAYDAFCNNLPQIVSYLTVQVMQDTCRYFHRRFKNLFYPIVKRREISELFKNTICAKIIQKSFSEFRNSQFSFPGVSIQLQPNASCFVANMEFLDQSISVEVRFPNLYPFEGVVLREKSSGVSSLILSTKWTKLCFGIRTFEENSEKCPSIAELITQLHELIDPMFRNVNECTICYQTGDPINGKFPSFRCQVCRHKFHTSCISKWFASINSSTCPMCRQVMI